MSEPYDFIDSFADAHHKAGLLPADELNYWLLHGYVFKSPDYFLIGGEDLDEPRNDVWFVYWAEVAPYLKNSTSTLALFLSMMPYYRPFIKFNRGVRGRYDGRIYSTDRLLRFMD